MTTSKINIFKNIFHNEIIKTVTINQSLLAQLMFTILNPVNYISWFLFKIKIWKNTLKAHLKIKMRKKYMNQFYSQSNFGASFKVGKKHNQNQKQLIQIWPIQRILSIASNGSTNFDFKYSVFNS